MNLFEHVQRTTGVQFLPLLELSCDLFVDVLRIAGIDQAEPIVSNENSYVCLSFDFTLPQDSDGGASQMSLVMGNAGGDITRDLENWKPGHPVKAKLMFVDPASPDEIFQTFYLPISNISVTTTAITAACGNRAFMQQKSSKLRYDQDFAPGLF